MSKDERDRRAAKKRREDPNADRKGKAKMVREEKSFRQKRRKDACYHKVKARLQRMAFCLEPLEPWSKCRKKDAPRTGVKQEERSVTYLPVGTGFTQKPPMTDTEVEYCLPTQLPVVDAKQTSVLGETVD